MLKQRQYSLVASRYAEALFLAAQRQGTLELVRNECQALYESRRSPRIRTFFESPRIPTENKLDVLTRTIAPNLSPLVHNLLRILVIRERIIYANEIFELFVDLVDQAAGIHKAIVQSAVPLGSAERDRLKSSLEAFTGCRLNIDYQVDSELIGGLVFRFRDTLIDSSLRSGLDEIGRRLRSVTLLAGAGA